MAGGSEHRKNTSRKPDRRQSNANSKDRNAKKIDAKSKSVKKHPRPSTAAGASSSAPGPSSRDGDIALPRRMASHYRRPSSHPAPSGRPSGSRPPPMDTMVEPITQNAVMSSRSKAENKLSSDVSGKAPLFPRRTSSVPPQCYIPTSPISTGAMRNLRLHVPPLNQKLAATCIEGSDVLHKSASSASGLPISGAGNQGTGGSSLGARASGSGSRFERVPTKNSVRFLLNESTANPSSGECDIPRRSTPSSSRHPEPASTERKTNFLMVRSHDGVLRTYDPADKRPLRSLPHGMAGNNSLQARNPTRGSVASSSRHPPSYNGPQRLTNADHRVLVGVSHPTNVRASRREDTEIQTRSRRFSEHGGNPGEKRKGKTDGGKNSGSPNGLDTLAEVAQQAWKVEKDKVEGRSGGNGNDRSLQGGPSSHGRNRDPVSSGRAQVARVLRHLRPAPESGPNLPDRPDTNSRDLDRRSSTAGPSRALAAGPSRALAAGPSRALVSSRSASPVRSHQSSAESRASSGKQGKGRSKTTRSEWKKSRGRPRRASTDSSNSGTSEEVRSQTSYDAPPLKSLKSSGEEAAEEFAGEAEEDAGEAAEDAEVAESNPSASDGQRENDIRAMPFMPGSSSAGPAHRTAEQGGFASSSSRQTAPALNSSQATQGGGSRSNTTGVVRSSGASSAGGNILAGSPITATNNVPRGDIARYQRDFIRTYCVPYSAEAGDPRVVCVICRDNRSSKRRATPFSEFGQFKRHFIRKHQQSKAYPCPLCNGRSFVTNSDRDRHLEALHHMQRCRRCNSLFRLGDNEQCSNPSCG